MRIRNGILATFLLLSHFLILQAQEINQFDSENKRHGKWMKKFEGSDQIRYEGTFDHGKEVGEFKFYRPSSGKQPTAIKIFDKSSDTAKVTYFTQKGKIISQGKMVGKNRVGEWKYYHKGTDNIMMTEQYVEGLLEGDQITYFENGKVTEKVNYVKGLKEGERIVYGDNGKKLKEFQYKGDKLHGAVVYYAPDGSVKIKGSYKNDKKEGMWEYYENGKLVEQKKFPLGKN